MPDYLLRVLGPPRVEAEDGRVVHGLSPLLLTLVAYLALHPKAQPRDQLAQLFWPGSTASKARHSLRQLLSRVRSRLPGVIATSKDHVGVDGTSLDTDLRCLEAALKEGGLGQAASLWRGDFLEGVSRPGSWEMEDWIDRERIRIQRIVETALSEAVRELLAASRPSEAADLLGRLPTFPPSDKLQLLHARALAAAGRRPEAEAALARLDLDEDDHRLQDVLEAMERSPPPSSETLDLWAASGSPEPEEAEPVPPMRDPSEDTGAEPPQATQAMAEPFPGSDVPPAAPHPPPEPPLASPGTPPPPPARRRWAPILATAAVLGAVAVALLLGGRIALNIPKGPPSFEAEIWFCSQRETEWAFRMDQDGGAKRSVSSEPVCPVVPYNGGTEAVALRTRDDATEVVRLAGGRSELLARLPGSSFLFYPPRQAGPLDGVVSPDGRWLVLTQVTRPGPGESHPTAPVPGMPGGRDDSAIWSLLLLDLRSGTSEEIVRSGTRDYGGRFSPDGSRIVWISERTGYGDLYAMDVESREVTRLTFHELPDREFSMAQDHLVLRRGWGDGPQEGGEEIVLLHLATGEEEPLTENDWNDAGLDLSAGGELLCWTSKKEGHWESEILVMDLRTRTVTNISASPGRDDYCQWHPTEPVVFFLSWRDGDIEIFRSEWGPKGPVVNLSRFRGNHEWPVVVAPR